MKQNKISQFILSLFFPSFCVGCNTEGSFLCSSCAQTCVIQRAPVAHTGTSAIAFTYAATEYREQPIVQKLITTLKYRGAKDAARHCADLVMRHLKLARFTPPHDCIMTAVPLHQKRFRERGFNQADCIARVIGTAFPIPYDPRLLLRTIHTPQQTHLQERKKRLENMRNAFLCIDKNRVYGKTVIIVDDVTTTGATLEACAQACKDAGARRVMAFVVAK